MSVLPSDIVVYGSANMPESDGAMTGGAIDFTRRVAFYDIAPAGNVDVISSSASDTATKITYYGRDPTGVIQSQTLTLNGQTWVTGTQPLAAHSCVLPAGSVTTDVTIHTAQSGSASHSGTTPALFKLQSGDGASVSPGQVIWIKSGTGANQLRQIVASSGYGTDVVAVNRDWATVPDNTATYKILQGMMFEISPNPVTAVIRLFSTTAADAPTGIQRIYYEKIFVVNNNTATALTGAQLETASETPNLPSGALVDLALTTALNDNGTIANRQTAPSSGVGAFISQATFVTVPGPGNLPSGASPNAAGPQGL